MVFLLFYALGSLLAVLRFYSWLCLRTMWNSGDQVSSMRGKCLPAIAILSLWFFFFGFWAYIITLALEVTISDYSRKSLRFDVYKEEISLLSPKALPYAVWRSAC